MSLKKYIKKDGKIQQVDEKIDAKKVEALRTNMPGYIGPDFAKKASDEDVLKMSDLKDAIAKITNSKLLPIENQIKQLRKKYKLK